MSEETLKLNCLRRWLSPIKILTICLYVIGVIWLTVFLSVDQKIAHFIVSMISAGLGIISNLIYIFIDHKIETGLNKEKWRESLRNIS